MPRAGLEAIERDGSAEVVLAGRTFTISRSFVEDARAHRLPERLARLGRGAGDAQGFRRHRRAPCHRPGHGQRGIGRRLGHLAQH